MAKKVWQKACLNPEDTLQHAIEVIDQAALKIGLVVDGQHHLLGVLTDGDIRRALLKHKRLDIPVSEVMNADPIVAFQDEPVAQLRTRMLQKNILHLPLVDASGMLVGLETLSDLMQPEVKENPVLLMAGGFGTRLRPLTHQMPKPLLRVGDKPILEHILESFLQEGFRKFYISVHYKAEMIKQYFGDGRNCGCEITYLEEEKPLGTAGCLRLLPEVPAQDMIVMNGDLLTQVNFSKLLEFHQQAQAHATLCVRDYSYQVPFGVVETDGHHLLKIEEKPTQHFFVSTGIYVLSPQFIEQVPEGYQDIPDLFQQATQAQKPVCVFPLHEYWLDIGRMDDFQRAQQEYVNFL